MEDVFLPGSLWWWHAEGMQSPRCAERRHGPDGGAHFGAEDLPLIYNIPKADQILTWIYISHSTQTFKYPQEDFIFIGNKH